MTDPTPRDDGKAVPKTGALAVASLLFGLCGIIPPVIFILIVGCAFNFSRLERFLFDRSPFTTVVVVLVSWILAILCGHLARGNPRRTGSRPGNGAAQAGLVLGYAGPALTFACFVVITLSQPHCGSRKNACINNLRQIDGAKEQWGLANRKTGTATPTWEDLVGSSLYIKASPVCKVGGTYTIGDLNTPPTCTIPQHELPR